MSVDCETFSDGGGDRPSAPWRFAKRGDQLHPQVGRQQGAWPQVCRLSGHINLIVNFVTPQFGLQLLLLGHWRELQQFAEDSTLQLEIRTSGALPVPRLTSNLYRNFLFWKASFHTPIWWPGLKFNFVEQKFRFLKSLCSIIAVSGLGEKYHLSNPRMLATGFSHKVHREVPWKNIAKYIFSKLFQGGFLRYTIKPIF